MFGVDMKIVDPNGAELARDGKASGDLLVRGSWIVQEYFKGEGGNILDRDGYFATGDVATIDPDGFMQITDRSKGCDQVWRRMDQFHRCGEHCDGPPGRVDGCPHRYSSPEAG